MHVDFAMLPVCLLITETCHLYPFGLVVHGLATTPEFYTFSSLAPFVCVLSSVHCSMQLTDEGCVEQPRPMAGRSRQNATNKNTRPLFSTYLFIYYAYHHGTPYRAAALVAYRASLTLNISLSLFYTQLSRSFAQPDQNSSSLC